MLLFLWNQMIGATELMNHIFTVLSSNLSSETILNLGEFILPIITLIIGGSFLTFIDFVSNYKHNKQIKLVSIFSETDKMKRLSGVQGIAKYSRSLYKELFFICSMENDKLIKEFVFNILQKQSLHSRRQCISINNFLIEYCLKHNYQSKDFKRLDINNEMLEILQNSPSDQRILFQLYQNKVSGISDSKNEINNHLLLSAQLIGPAIKNSFFTVLRGYLIAQSDLYASKWVYVLIQNCVFIEHVSSHMFSLSAKYQDSFIKYGNYSSSKFINTAFTDCKIQHCIFNNSHFINSKFQKESDAGTSDKGSARSRQKTLIIGNSQWKDCKIIHCKYDKVQFLENQMIRTKFSDITFADVQFFRVELIGGSKKNNLGKIIWVKFKRCTFRNVKWGASLVKYVQFINCQFENVTFDGCKLENIEFIKCSFENAYFNKIKFITDTKFLKCQFKKLAWSDTR